MTGPTSTANRSASGASVAPPSRKRRAMGVSAAWRDRSGRFSALRLAVFALALGPGVWLALLLASGAAGAEPAETALDITGVWTVRFLLLSLAVTPLRRIFGWTKLIQVRRMLGVTAASYAGLHFTAYLFDQGLDLGRAVSEIFVRFYLTVGFAALAGLVVLAVTSTDRWIRRLGTRWNALHRLVYIAAALALWHYLMQSKLDAAQATWMAGLFALLMLYRIAAWRKIALGPLVLAGLALCAIPLTMAFELAWYAATTSLPVERVWAANFSLYGTPRPAWLVGASGLALALLAGVHRLYRRATA